MTSLRVNPLFIRVTAWWCHWGWIRRLSESQPADVTEGESAASSASITKSPTKYLKLLQTLFSLVIIFISHIWSYLLTIKILSDINNLILTRQNRFFKYLNILLNLWCENTWRDLWWTFPLNWTYLQLELLHYEMTWGTCWKSKLKRDCWSDVKRAHHIYITEISNILFWLVKVR